MCGNGKITPVITISKMGEEGIKENDVGEFN
jgi:hypothetical protein